MSSPPFYCHTCGVDLEVTQLQLQQEAEFFAKHSDEIEETEAERRCEACSALPDPREDDLVASVIIHTDQ